MHSKGICNEVYVFLNELISLYNITKMNHLKRKGNIKNVLKPIIISERCY